VIPSIDRSIIVGLIYFFFIVSFLSCEIVSDFAEKNGTIVYDPVELIGIKIYLTFALSFGIQGGLYRREKH